MLNRFTVCLLFVSRAVNASVWKTTFGLSPTTCTERKHSETFREMWNACPWQRPSLFFFSVFNNNKKRISAQGLNSYKDPLWKTKQRKSLEFYKKYPTCMTTTSSYTSLSVTSLCGSAVFPASLFTFPTRVSAFLWFKSGRWRLRPPSFLPSLLLPRCILDLHWKGPTKARTHL